MFKTASVEHLREEFMDYPAEVTEMARSVAKDFEAKGFSIHDAKSVLRACDIHIEMNYGLKSLPD